MTMRTLRLLRSVTVTIPMCLLTTVGFILASLSTLLFDRSGAAEALLFRGWAKCILYICRVTVTVRGEDSVKPGQPAIFVANHESLIDVPVLVAQLPLRLVFLVKHGLFRLPIIALYLRTYGHISVRRDSVRSSIKAVHAAVDALRDRSVAIVLFPEGTRSLGGLLDFKPGAALVG